MIFVGIVALRINLLVLGTLANIEVPNSGISLVSALFIKIFNNLQVKFFIILKKF